MRAFFLSLLVSALPLLAHPADVPGIKTDKLPDMVHSCQKTCPNAGSTSDAVACVERYEYGHGGDGTLKQHDPRCYDAQKKFDQMTEPQEAGKAQQSQNEDPDYEPYRWG